MRRSGAKAGDVVGVTSRDVVVARAGAIGQLGVHQVHRFGSTEPLRLAGWRVDDVPEVSDELDVHRFLTREECLFRPG